MLNIQATVTFGEAAHRRAREVSVGDEKLCTWCNELPAVMGDECASCWRLPGHEGEWVSSYFGRALTSGDKDTPMLVELQPVPGEVAELERLEADNRVLREALAWYADAAHYENPKYGGLKDIEADGGKIARDALAKGGA